MESQRIEHDWATNPFTFFQTSPSTAKLLGGTRRGNWPLLLPPPAGKLQKVQKITYSVPRALKTRFCLSEHLAKNKTRTSVSLCISVEALPQYQLHNIRLFSSHNYSSQTERFTTTRGWRKFWFSFYQDRKPCQSCGRRSSHYFNC